MLSGELLYFLFYFIFDREKVAIAGCWWFFQSYVTVCLDCYDFRLLGVLEAICYHLRSLLLLWLLNSCSWQASGIFLTTWEIDLGKQFSRRRENVRRVIALLKLRQHFESLWRGYQICIPYIQHEPQRILFASRSKSGYSCLSSPASVNTIRLPPYSSATSAWCEHWAA